MHLRFENVQFSMRFSFESTLKRSKTHAFEKAVQNGGIRDLQIRI